MPVDDGQAEGGILYGRKKSVGRNPACEKTGKLMKELAELNGFTVSGTVKLTSVQNGISINIHFSETDN